MNKHARIVINTPVGSTEEFVAKEIVKQGTIFGPKLCCASTDKVNEIGEKTPITYITPKLYIKGVIFVDDIAAAGRKEVVETIGNNLIKMEKEKKFRFSTSKSNIMIIKSRKQQKEEGKIEINVHQGQIQYIEQYKYLGFWLNEKGSLEIQLNKIKTKVPGMIEELKRMASFHKIGKFDLQGQLVIYESTVIPSILYGLEVWSKFGKSEIEELGKIQAKAIKRILGLPTSTPYYGILMETGMWTIHARVSFKKLMLYYNIKHSDGNRIIKKILEYQEQNDEEDTWWNEIKNIIEKYKINSEEGMELSKEMWKKYIKNKINIELEREIKIKCEEMTKLKIIKNDKYEMKEYMKTLCEKEVSIIMVARLNMNSISFNHGKLVVCRMCQDELESLEHLFECDEIRNKINENADMNMLQSKNKSELLKAVKYIQKYIEIAE